MDNLIRLQSAIRAAQLDALLLIDARNRYYATGFHSTDGAVVVTPDKAYFITDSRYIEAAQETIGDRAEVLLCDRERPMRQCLQTILADCAVQKLGAEDGSLTYADYLSFERILGLQLIPAQQLVMQLRQSKQPHELAYLRQAQEITDRAFADVLPLIRPGVTEREIAAELVYRMLKYGGEGNSFDPIVVTGRKTSMPHGVPGDVAVQPGDFVTMDFGCLKGGYCSDMTRTVAVGHASEEMRRVYDTVLQAQLAGIAAARAGVTGAEIDGAARGVIANAGYGPYFGHSFGHSLGLDIHESPNAAPNNDQPMPEHAVVSAEPGIYLPGRFGVRIEDVLHLTADGAEDITHSPKDLLIL